MASEVEWVPVSLVASSDQRSTSDFTRASQARLACSYASSNSFCIRSITSVCSFPTLRNGIDASVDLVAIAYLPFEQVTYVEPLVDVQMYIKDDLRERWRLTFYCNVELLACWSGTWRPNPTSCCPRQRISCRNLPWPRRKRPPRKRPSGRRQRPRKRHCSITLRNHRAFPMKRPFGARSRSSSARWPTAAPRYKCTASRTNCARTRGAPSSSRRRVGKTR